MTDLARVKFVFLAWLAASLFFAVAIVLVTMGGADRFLLFWLHTDFLHFAIWAAVLPFLARWTRHFPLGKGERRTRNWGLLFLLLALLAPLVTVVHISLVYWTYFPYDMKHPGGVGHVLQVEMGKFIPLEFF